MGAPAWLFKGWQGHSTQVGGAGRCVVSACMGMWRNLVLLWGVMDGKSLEVSDLLLNDKSGCCWENQLFEWKLGNL